MNIYWTIWNLCCLNGDQILDDTINSRGFYTKNFWLLTKPYIVGPNRQDGEYILDFGYFLDDKSYDNKSRFPGLAVSFPSIVSTFRVLGGFVGGNETKLKFKYDYIEKLSYNSINRTIRPGRFLIFYHNRICYAIFQGLRTRRMHLVRLGISVGMPLSKGQDGGTFCTPFIFFFIPLSINFTMNEINRNLELLSTSEIILEVHDS